MDPLVSFMLGTGEGLAMGANPGDVGFENLRDPAAPPPVMTGAALPQPQAPAPGGAGAAPSSWDWSPYLVDGATRPDAISGLDDGFERSLQSMIANAPPEVQGQLRLMSGYRSVERQTQLWEQALAKYGSAEAADNWVAPPGRSHHNHGGAVDLRYLSDSARDWVHANAAAYGMQFPLSNEPWHIEPIGSRNGQQAPHTPGSHPNEPVGSAPLAPGHNTPAAGAGMASSTSAGTSSGTGGVNTAAHQELALAMIQNGMELAPQSGSPLLSFLAPLAGAWAGRRATRTSPTSSTAGLDALAQAGLMDDPQAQAAIQILQDPNTPEWQRDLAETMLREATDQSTASQALTGQITGPDGNLYGQDRDGNLVPYTTADGQVVTAAAQASPSSSASNARLTGQIKGADGILYGQNAQGQTVPYIGPDGQPMRYPEPASRAPGAGPVTYRPATAAELRQYGANNGQVDSRGQFHVLGGQSPALAAASAQPLPPEPSIPSDGGALSADDQALLDRYSS